MSKSALTPMAAARVRSGLSLADVAQAVQCDRSGLSRIERGHYRPRPELAGKLAKLLNISRDQILFPEEYAPKPAKPRRAAQLRKAA